MAKQRVVFQCSACGSEHAKWSGQCPTCGEWATIDEGVSRDEPVAGAHSGWTGGAAMLMADVPTQLEPVTSTGVGELDRALGGGLVTGSVTLLGGEPGIGKSTLLLQMAGAASDQDRRVLYVSAEESAGQLRRRAGRLAIGLEHVFVQAETDLGKVLSEVQRLRPDLVLVDSIQTVHSSRTASVPGSVAQVRECTQAFIDRAKQDSIPTVLVGHVTKEGTLAGPRTLEHLVDTVVSFEGDRNQQLRFLRAVKHRFGATGEPGVLEMTEDGLVGVADPSGLFLADRQAGTPGSSVVPVLDGHRPLLVEVQALVAPSRAGSPRRAAQGFDSGRLSVILAVLERRCQLPVLDNEAYVSVVGGVRVVDPGADLGVALAVASSVSNRPLPEDLVVCGEIGLAGELRQPSQVERRLDEAARLGFRRAIVPASVGPVRSRIDVMRAATLAEAMRQARVSAVVSVA